MKAIIIGGQGTIGSLVVKHLQSRQIEVITAGRSRDEYCVDITDEQSLESLFNKIGKFDAVISAAGSIEFGPTSSLTKEQWDLSLKSKFMGQINIAQKALPYLNDGGSITLVSGILSDYHVAGGTIATTINRAIEGYVMAAANELPRKIRINAVSPSMLKESVPVFGSFFPGVKPVEGNDVALAFIRSILGIQTGQVFKVYS